MDAKNIINEIKQFDFSKFSWTEACVGPDGKSSAGKMLCFWFGWVLIMLTLIGGLLYFCKWVDASDINNIFIFVGIQMPIVLGYLLSNKSIENKAINTPPAP
jgi:hypothetical protein